MQPAITQAVVMYAIAAGISMLVALMIKGLFAFVQRRSRSERR